MDVVLQPAKFILLSIVAEVCTTLPDGTLTNDIRTEMSDLDRFLTLTHEYALEKVMDMARVINDGTDGFAKIEGQPFVTLFVTVHQGEVTKMVTEFESSRKRIEEEKKEAVK